MPYLPLYLEYSRYSVKYSLLEGRQIKQTGKRFKIKAGKPYRGYCYKPNKHDFLEEKFLIF